MRSILVLAMLSVWGLAAWFWPELPERIPMHFDMAGDPDRFADKSVWSWFLMPTLGTVLTIGVGLLLPGWIRSMAASNSALLNMPDRRRFRALPTEARLRVVEHTMLPLRILALLLQGLFAWIVYSSAQVALGHWSRLPTGTTIAFVAAVIVCATWLCLRSLGAIAREATAAPGDGAS
ncbi:MAG: DUF1648 domain-containing protein [Planctomycetes bacterium]|nr:DUF1648 domain-containing protein [Planctomycetota bacterium]